MKNKVFFKASWKDKVFLMLIGMFFVAIDAGATSYYYFARANADLSAGGRVYVSSTQTNNPVYQDAPMVIRGSGEGIGSYDQNLYFYATNNVGYTFKGWRNSSGSIESTSIPYKVTKEINSRNQNDNYRTRVIYTAVFEEVQGLVQAYTTNASRGTVTISKENNVIGDNVTITAIPDASQGIKFLGWKLSNSEDAPFVTTESPYTITVSGPAVYYAFFTEPAQMVYCVLKNKGSGRYLSLYGDGAASEHKTDVTVQIPVAGNKTFNVLDGYDFNNGLKMLDESKAIGNPMTVFKRKSTAVGNTEVGDLATDVYMTSGDLHLAISVAALTGKSNQDIIFEQQNNGSFRVYVNITNNVTYGFNTYSVTSPSYLYDAGDDFVHLRSTNDMSANDEKGTYWDIYFLTEDQVEGAFGANAKSKYTQGGMYYTTMYAPFAYKLLDGVNAYYLPMSKDSYKEETNTVVFQKIASGGIVPANTAVILECQNADDPTRNRLLPVSDETTITGTSHQLLKGYTQLYSRDTKKQNTIANGNLRYVLSIKNDKLGFYHYSGSNMNPNKAFLELPAPLDELAAYLAEHNDGENLAKTVTFSFGDPDIVAPSDPTGIELSDQMVDEDDSTPVYNLNGTKVAEGRAAENMLRPGVYVKKGKKFVVK